MIKELSIQNRKSTKSDKNFVCLVADLGYCEKIISFDGDICAELSGLSFPEFHDFRKNNVGQKIVLVVGDKK